MKKQMAIAALLGVMSFAACVPAKQYKDLKTDYEQAVQKNNRLSDALADAQQAVTEKSDLLAQLKKAKEECVETREDLQQQQALLEKKYRNLEESYKALEAHSSSALAANAKQNRALLRKIEAKREKLNAERTQLEKLKNNLHAREKRIADLEAAIAAKENQMRELKENISAALTDFEGKGLHVHRKNGKVYVSMENKLLFDSGSWAINANGREAVRQLGTVLAKNPDINVLIEGHTDNVPYNGGRLIKDNWDLSMKRATAVVRILLQNNGIDPANITAAGRSKYVPVASNATASGRAKNRRIEVILTPEWDKLAHLLETND